MRYATIKGKTGDIKRERNDKYDDDDNEDDDDDDDDDDMMMMMMMMTMCIAPLSGYYTQINNDKQKIASTQPTHF